MPKRKDNTLKAGKCRKRQNTKVKQVATQMKCEECGKSAIADSNEYKNKRDKALRKVASKKALRAQHWKDRGAGQSRRMTE